MFTTAQEAHTNGDNFKMKWADLVERWDEIPDRVLHLWAICCVRRCLQHLHQKDHAVDSCLTNALTIRQEWVEGQVSDEDLVAAQGYVRGYMEDVWGEAVHSCCSIWNATRAVLHLCENTNADRLAEFANYYALRSLAPFPRGVPKNHRAAEIHRNALRWQRTELLRLVKEAEAEEERRRREALARLRDRLEAALF